ncbi:MAG TPA: flavodoxin domain-containing protein [Candidatus Limnocylindrales bacterium]
MRALVVYESMFGNTKAVAVAIAEGVGTHLAVDAIEVGEAPMTLPPDVGLLVVGGPTHAHGMTSAKSRADAAQRAGDRLVSRAIGMREWLERLDRPAGSLPAAAFDTRIKGPELLWGSAAKGAAKRLKDLGFRLLEPPQSFVVGGPAGEMFDRLPAGELERARAWGGSLAAALASHPVTR